MKQENKTYDMLMAKVFETYNAERELKSKACILTYSDDVPDTMVINEFETQNKSLKGDGFFSAILDAFKNKMLIDEHMERLKSENNHIVGLLKIDVIETENFTNIHTIFQSKETNFNITYEVKIKEEEKSFINENGAMINEVFTFTKQEEEK